LLWLDGLFVPEWALPSGAGSVGRRSRDPPLEPNIDASAQSEDR
jgi:hypothetical protein